MDGTALHHCAALRAEELPGVVLGHPFGPEHDVYKVCGKVMMLLGEVRGELIVTLKARPADSQVLQQAFVNITPGYHMNKRHWLTVRPADAFESAMLVDLITESYLLVVETLPRAVRPVDPSTFGQANHQQHDRPGVAARSPQE